MSRLENKVAVITGAASGIGRASALLFAKKGAAVVVCDLNVTGGEETAHQCVAADGRAAFIRTDVSEEVQVRAAVELVVKRYGGLHVLFNNAGLGGAVGTIEEVTTENWDRTMAVLLRSVFLGMKYAVPVMRQGGGGTIISTASVAGLRGGAAPHAYSAAKAAVINLTRSVALEVGKDRIRVNCICPGAINTPLLYKRMPGGSAEMSAQFLAQIQPIARAGTPEDIAAMALFLASDEAEWITGAAMVVDGGLTAGSGFNRERLALALPAGFSGPSFEH